MRTRLPALAVAAAAFAAVALAPGASGHSLSPLATESFNKEGHRGVYRYYTMTVPARHSHTVRCPRGHAAYPERVLVRNRAITRHHVVLDDQEEHESPPSLPDHTDDNEIAVTFEGQGVLIKVTDGSLLRRDPSDFGDSGPRYGRDFTINADGRRGSRMRVLCYQRFRG